VCTFHFFFVFFIIFSWLFFCFVFNCSNFWNFQNISLYIQYIYIYLSIFIFSKFQIFGNLQVDQLIVFWKITENKEKG
jgi:hypothetical protein